MKTQKQTFDKNLNLLSPNCFSTELTEVQMESLEGGLIRHLNPGG